MRVNNTREKRGLLVRSEFGEGNGFGGREMVSRGVRSNDRGYRAFVPVSYMSSLGEGQG